MEVEGISADESSLSERNTEALVSEMSSFGGSCEATGEDDSVVAGFRRNLDPPKVRGVTGLGFSILWTLVGGSISTVDGSAMGDERSSISSISSYCETRVRLSRTRLLGESKSEQSRFNYTSWLT